MCSLACPCDFQLEADPGEGYRGFFPRNRTGPCTSPALLLSV